VTEPTAETDVKPCAHCGEPTANVGGHWIHARVAPDGNVYTGKARCQSGSVPYGHLAHPADVPCPADGPNPCLGALNPTGRTTP
jgi:hypothetical protein